MINPEVTNWSLLIFDEEGLWTLSTVCSGSLMVGRSTEAQIQLPDADISRLHFRLDFTPNGPVIQDLYTTNGTYVNGQKLHPDEIIRLRSGDLISIGCTSLLLISSTLDLSRLLEEESLRKRQETAPDQPTRLSKREN